MKSKKTSQRIAAAKSDQSNEQDGRSQATAEDKSEVDERNPDGVAESKTPSESAIRQKAIRKGYRLTKLREAGCWFDQYGPYMLADASTNGALVHSLTLAEANEWLANNDAASWLACTSK